MSATANTIDLPADLSSVDVIEAARPEPAASSWAIGLVQNGHGENKQTRICEAGQLQFPDPTASLKYPGEQ